MGVKSRLEEKVGLRRAKTGGICLCFWIVGNSEWWCYGGPNLACLEYDIWNVMHHIVICA